MSNEIPSKQPSHIRLVSFNVNGVKTLKDYHPWNQRWGYDSAFHYMNADIVNFQELKTQRSDMETSLVNPTDYQAFISVPMTRKGYSGVGVFVRKPGEDEPEMLRKALNVKRAEEGITGYLHMKTARKSYRDCLEDDQYKNQCIGGYPDIDNAVEGRHLDSEGRCVLVELEIGLVVISVYCPANSVCTDEGEKFRLSFLQCLFERAGNLRQMGKEVVIMGDINVSPNLIDSDDYISNGLNEGTLDKPADIEQFEEVNKEEVLAFKKSTQARKLLNDYVFDTTGFEQDKDRDKLLHDVTREIQGRRLKMYSVWNTQKNTRPLNVGSRIDLFLATSGISGSAVHSDIWPFLYGSDHCPAFCDFDVTSEAVVSVASRQVYDVKCNCNHFKATNYYGIGGSRTIASFFRKADKSKDGEKKVVEVEEKKKPRKRRGQMRLTGLITVKKVKKEVVEKEPKITSSLFVSDSESEIEEVLKPKMTVEGFKALLEKKSAGGPLCLHNRHCVLKTVKRSTSKNAGRKFWCCPQSERDERWSLTEKEKPANGPPPEEFNCGFFKWADKAR